MSGRRLFTKESPGIMKGIGGVRFYQSDVDYIMSHGVSVAAVLRDALHAHVLQMQEHEILPIMEKQIRDLFVMKGIVPDGVKYTPKKDPGVFFRPDPEPRIVFDIPTKNEGPSSADMLAWTKEQRDRYILTGEAPRLNVQILQPELASVGSES